jgi:REP element-mobilizing transposase RayT
MPRSARSCSGGYTYHVLDRGNARATVFHGPEDYDAFLEVMTEAAIRAPMRILAYCLMPNHFHLAIWPREDGELSRWMQWLMTTHVSRYLMADIDLGNIRQSVRRDRPFGTSGWTVETAQALSLEYSLRSRGRPRPGINHQDNLNRAVNVEI